MVNTAKKDLKKDLNPYELIFYFITIKNYKKDVHYWLNHLNQLLEGEKEMKEIRPSIQYEIKHYLSDLKDFSESLMKALITNDSTNVINNLKHTVKRVNPGHKFS